MRGTVYLITADGVPFARTVLEVSEAGDADDFQSVVRARMAEHLAAGSTVEFGPVGDPWRKS